MDDKRFERELKNKEILQEQADKGASKASDQVSASFCRGRRMQAVVRHEVRFNDYMSCIQYLISYSIRCCYSTALTT